MKNPFAAMFLRLKFKQCQGNKIVKGENPLKKIINSVELDDDDNNNSDKEDHDNDRKS